MKRETSFWFYAKVSSIFGSALLILLVSAVGLHEMNKQQQRQEASVRARVIMRVSTELHLQITEIDAGYRGYLLTRDKRYVAPFYDIRRRVFDKINELDSIRVEKDFPRSTLSALLVNCLKKVDGFEQSLARQQRNEDPAAFLYDETSQDTTNEIAADIASILRSQEKNRDINFEKAERLSFLSKVVVGFGCAAAFLISLLNSWWLAQATRFSNQERMTAENHAKNAEKKTFVLAEHEGQLVQQINELQGLTACLRLTNKDLQRSNLDLDQFAYIASHDLKAPLRGIHNLSQWIEDDLGALITEKNKEQFSTLRGRVKRLENLISAIASYARAGRTFSLVEPVNVEELVAQIVELLPVSPAFKIRTQNLPSFETIRLPLEQILLNLITNAIKYSDSSCEAILVSAREATSFYEFSVKDDGPGIDKTYHEKVFGVFQRLESRDKVEGTGIGLAIVKKLIERVGGQVWIDSTLGHGTTFVFSWPKVIQSSHFLQ